MTTVFTFKRSIVSTDVQLTRFNRISIDIGLCYNLTRWIQILGVVIAHFYRVFRDNPLDEVQLSDRSVASDNSMELWWHYQPEPPRAEAFSRTLLLVVHWSACQIFLFFNKWVSQLEIACQTFRRTWPQKEEGALNSRYMRLRTILCSCATMFRLIGVFKSRMLCQRGVAFSAREKPWYPCHLPLLSWDEFADKLEHYLLAELLLSWSPDMTCRAI